MNVSPIDPSNSAIMRAAIIQETGPPTVLRVKEVGIPEPVSDELLVRIEAAGVNPIDAKTRAGRGVSSAIQHFPCILGSDFSGYVVKAPYEAHLLQPGDRVYGMLPVPRMNGSYADFAAVSSLNVARAPRNVDYLHAAALPLASLTAWGAVVKVAQVEVGQRVLIHGGAGGVGHLAVQLAKLRGAEVITTASERNADWLSSLGASQVIDYSSTRFEHVVRGVDVVIDLIGNTVDETGSRSLEVMRRGGIIVNVPSGSWGTLVEDAQSAGVRSSHYKVSGDGVILNEITSLVEAGDLKVHVDQTYSLDEIPDAHRALEGGHVRGKLVIDLLGRSDT